MAMHTIHCKFVIDIILSLHICGITGKFIVNCYDSLVLFRISYKLYICTCRLCWLVVLLELYSFNLSIFFIWHPVLNLSSLKPKRSFFLIN